MAMKNIASELRKFVAPEFVFGEGARNLAARYAVNFGGTKVLLVTDPGVMAAGWPNEVARGLTSANIPFHMFSSVTPNPKADEVMAGALEYERENCDIIVAVGGGSVIDCAKGIGVAGSNRMHVLEFEGVDQVPSPGPPLICVPTTGGSAADVSQFAIITDQARRVKITIISKALVPDVSLIDPLTLTTKPRELTAHTGMDALAHAFEAYVSNASSPVTDLFALEAVRLMASSLVPVLNHPDDTALRARTMLASTYAGLAFSNAGLGLLHAMAHSLGGYLDIAHGESNSILLNGIISFNFPAAPDRYAALAEALGTPLPDPDPDERQRMLKEAIERLKKALQIDISLGQTGVERHHIPGLSAQALDDPCVATNPRRPSLKDIEDIYEQAL